MKYLITGLGNPGPEYELTRHNIGFLIVDALAGDNLDFRSARYGQVCEIRIKNKTAILLKPETYMNLSGKAVRYWLNELKIQKENLLVITDDIALPTGKLRMRPKGSSAGHNGLKSIEEHLEGQDYARLRFGIGNDFPKGKQVDYVLGAWKDDEWGIVKEKIPVAREMAQSFVLEGIDRTMAKWNN